jgi:hypothetical protein
MLSGWIGGRRTAYEFRYAKLGRFILGHTEEASHKGPPLLYPLLDSFRTTLGL